MRCTEAIYRLMGGAGKRNGDDEFVNDGDQGAARATGPEPSRRLRPGPGTPRRRVGLAALDAFEVGGVDQHQVQPGVLQRVEHRVWRSPGTTFEQ